MSEFGTKSPGRKIKSAWMNEVQRMLGYGSATTPYVFNSKGESWTCDGTADDVQLQLASDSISAGGKVGFVGDLVTSATWKPAGDDIEICGIGSSSITSSATPLLSFEEHKGSTTLRQKRIYAHDFTLDSNNVTDGDCLQLWNVHDSDFNNITLKNFKQYGLYLDGETTSNTGHCYWNRFSNFYYEATSTAVGASGRAAIFCNKSIDSQFDYHRGVCTNGVGYHRVGCGGDRVRGLWLTDTINAIYLTSTNAAIYDCHFRDFAVDKPTAGLTAGAGIRLTIPGANTINHSTFIGAKYFHVAQNTLTENILFEGAGGSEYFTYLTFQGLEDNSNATYHATDYTYQWDGGGNRPSNNCRFVNNNLVAGHNGSNDGIPTSCFYNDVRVPGRDYQQINNAADQPPAWVGTPTTGNVCRIYNATTGHSHSWIYVAGAWAQMT